MVRGAPRLRHRRVGQHRLDDEWETIVSWIEEADGTRRPATPEAVAEFMKRWNTEVGAE